MYSVSSRWDSALRGSGPRIIKIDIYDRWDTTPTDADPPGDPSYTARGINMPGTLLVENAGFSSFTFTVDRQSDIRRSANVTINDDTFYEIISALSPNPFGLEFDISMGFQYGVDDQELVPVGIFGIDTFEYSYGDTEVRLRLVDRSRRLQSSPGEAYLSSGSGIENLEQIIPVFFTFFEYGHFYDGVVEIIENATNSTLVPPGLYTAPDPLTVIQQTARTLELETYFGVDGNYYITDLATLSPSATVNDADWSIDIGADGVLIGATIGGSLYDFANNIRVEANDVDSSSTPSVGTAADDDYVNGSYSLTSTKGPAGMRTKTYKDQRAVDLASANTAAESYLNEFKGMPKSIRVTGLANPALEAGDIVAVSYPNGSVELHLLDNFTINQDWSMTMTTRAQRLS